MCPFCLATMGSEVADAVSAGGLAALAVRARENRTGEVLPNSDEANTRSRVAIWEDIKVAIATDHLSD
jgi:hypothetical protein